MSATTTLPATGAARHALPLLLLGALGIAFSPLFVRASEVGPLATGFWRLGLAVPLMALWVASGARGGKRAATAKDWASLGLAGLCITGDLVLWHYSIAHTNIANSTLLANFAPVFVAAGAWLFLGERFGWSFLAGLALAMAGAAMLMGGSFTVGTDQLLGDLLALGAAGFYGTYLVVVKRARDCFSTAEIMLWTSASGALALLLLTLLAEPVLLPPSLTGWLLMLGLAWISHAAGQGLIAFSLAHLPAAFSSVALLLQPAGAAVLAWFIFGEALSAWQIAGGIVILAGILQARRGSR